MAQWLWLPASPAGDTGSASGQETEILYAMQQYQIDRYIYIICKIMMSSDHTACNCCTEVNLAKALWDWFIIAPVCRWWNETKIDELTCWRSSSTWLWSLYRAMYWRECVIGKSGHFRGQLKILGTSLVFFLESFDRISCTSVSDLL